MTAPRRISPRRSACLAAALVIGSVLGPVDAATGQGRSEHRGFFSLNGVFQATTSDFADDASFTLFVEEGDFEANYNGGTGVAFDAAGGVRVWRNLAVGVGVSIFDTDSSTAVTASLPHPLHFDRHRQVDGTADGLMRRERGIHVQATWMMPVSDRLDLSIFGGPTFFTVDQDLVTEVMFEHTFPFDTASFTGTATSSQSESAVGFHVGIDVAFYLSANVGVGGVARFSRATVDFSSVGGSIVSTDAGGLQAGGGLRVRF